jgi:hypothetical protein
MLNFSFLNYLKAKTPSGGGLIRVIIISLFATLACVGIIKAATTIGTNISTGGTITGSGANTLYGATSIGGALTATSTLSVTGITTLGNASTTMLTVSGNTWLATTTLVGSLGITGDTTFTGDLTMSGSTVNMDGSTIQGDVIFSNTLYESQPFEINGRKINIVNPYSSKNTSVKGAMHTHVADAGADLDDSTEVPADMAAFYAAAGYGFMVVTTHNNVYDTSALTGLTVLQGEERGPTSGGTAFITNGHIGAVGITADLTAEEDQAVIDEVNSESGLSIMNHSNFANRPWTDTELELAYSYWGMEIYNEIVEAGTPGTGNSEADWDLMLGKGRNIMGISSDDCHDKDSGDCNKAWVVVYIDSNTSANILDSLKRGNFYSTTGPTLTVTVSGTTMTATTNAPSTIDFIGTAGTGTPLQSTVAATTASYTITGNESYIRIKVTQSGEWAWSNPIWVEQANPDVLGGLAVDGNAYIGSTGWSIMTGSSPAVLNVTHGSGNYGLAITRADSNGTGSAGLTFARTLNNNGHILTGLADGNGVGAINFLGVAADGEVPTRGGYLVGSVDGTVASASLPIRLRFYSQTSGSTSAAAEKWGIRSSGVVEYKAQDFSTVPFQPSSVTKVFYFTRSLLDDAAKQDDTCNNLAGDPPDCFTLPAVTTHGLLMCFVFGTEQVKTEYRINLDGTTVELSDLGDMASSTLGIENSLNIHDCGANNACVSNDLGQTEVVTCEMKYD